VTQVQIMEAPPGSAAASVDDETAGQAGGVAALTAAVAALRGDLIASLPTPELVRVHAAHRQDAENLLHYLSLRGRDVRELQERLADLGLSSLGRSEGHVLATVEAVLRALRALADGEPSAAVATAGTRPPAPGGVEDGLTFARGRHLLAANAEALLGPPGTGRQTRIMVTLPGSAADDHPLVRTLIERGMDCARINCAHDDAATWARMIDHVRAASRELGRPCLVAMDLAGPKLRTGPIAPGPQVVRLRPTRDAYGRVTSPAVCWLVADDAVPGRGAERVLSPGAAPDPATGLPADGIRVPVPRAFLAALRAGDQIHLQDTRGARRCLRVTAVTAAGARAEAGQTTYLASGTSLHTGRGDDDAGRSAHVGELPPLEQSLRLRVGDALVLTCDVSPVDPPAPGGTARIGCTLPEVFGQVEPGHRVWFDDGKIGAVVTAAGPAELVVRITDAAPAGTRLRGGKGINLPDTDLPVSALTTKDQADLVFVAARADIVSLSFVRHPDDVTALQDALAAAGRDDIGIVLKIETLRAFENLPQLLLTALRRRRVGVMIARGDLAVECGYERLAELQEEILWLCEAAHVPVIWATQVLDQLARTGRPTRAEITDAAMAERAECVLLNKGPYITDAVALLDDVLTRMSDHQHKKIPLLRELRSWHVHAGQPSDQ
jgi:pyruvate kinase